MKSLHFLILTVIFSSCSERKKQPTYSKEVAHKNHIINTAFQSIIDTAKVTGSILIYDVQKDIYHSNDFEWADIGRLPASTFKIANSIMALESGAVENDSVIFKWDGQERALKIWEQDLILKDAFQFSCVPCYQEVARKIGSERMNKYLAKLDYGNMQVDSVNIDIFWLEGDSRISQFEQIDFLKRFHESELPIAERTKTITKRLMLIKRHANYTLSGKTGWAIRDGNNNGWFVGYLEKENEVYYFATNIEPTTQFDMQYFPIIRKKVTLEALKRLKVIE